MVENLPIPYNDCYKDMKSSELKDLELVQRIIKSNYSYYDRQSCFSLYYRREQTRVCNCSIDTEWEVEGLETCRTIKFTKCLTDVYNNIIYETDDFNTKVLKECPEECDYTIYSKSVLVSDYGTPVEVEMQLRNNDYLRERHPNSTWQEVRDTILLLRIFYDELKYTHQSQIPKWQIADFVSAIGGTLGLFMGMSFMSLFEIIFLICEILFIYCSRKIGQYNVAKIHISNLK